MGAGLDGGLGGQCDLGSTVGGLPGASGNRRTGVETVVAQLAMQAAGLDVAQRARRPGEGQQVTLVAQLDPALPGALEEIQVIGAVYPQQRRAAIV
ncbi:hypothetical protein D3C80_1887010 [compost metagenome]